MGACDRHPSALARVIWEKDALMLAFCHHCSTRNEQALWAQDFTRVPENATAAVFSSP